MVVIKCLKVWRHYLEKAKVQFEIWIDHKNLQYTMTSQKLNHRQTKYVLYLSRFDFVLKYMPRRSIKKKNRLNRRADQQEGVKRDNKHRMLTKLEQIR